MSKSPVVHPTKNEAFDAIKHSLADWAVYTSDRAVVAHGDSLNLVKQMPDDSVSLILTDPPYHSTKKANIVNDRAFREDEAFIEWIENIHKNGNEFFDPTEHCMFLLFSHVRSLRGNDVALFSSNSTCCMD